VVIALIAWWRAPPRIPVVKDAGVSTMRFVPLTSLPGAATGPAFSPDGKQFAFFWNAETPAKWNLYVQLVGGENPLQLTHTVSRYLCCADWSPDGREIAFARCDDGGGSIFVVPTLGGPERKLTDVVCGANPSWIADGSPRWTADGSSLVLADRTAPEASCCFLWLPVRSDVYTRRSLVTRGNGIQFYPRIKRQLRS